MYHWHSGENRKQLYSIGNIILKIRAPFLLRLFQNLTHRRLSVRCDPVSKEHSVFYFDALCTILAALLMEYGRPNPILVRF